MGAMALTLTLVLAQHAAAKTTLRLPLVGDLLFLKQATPFQDNNGTKPPASYTGPSFKLSHAWPTQPLPPLADAPWRKAIQNGPITVQNAPAYAAALKAAVATNGRDLIVHYDTWDAAKAGWYNEPWLGSQREPIHGAYSAGEFAPELFPNTGLKSVFRTTVVTYYDARAAYSLRKVWGDAATTPTLTPSSAQFDEGSIIVKAAVFFSETPAPALGWWDAMDGAQAWPLFQGAGPQSNPGAPVLRPGYVAQFDIIVKDSESSPKTGWVFMTLVYDSRAPGDLWDKMVPLGAQWGNDPQATVSGMPLRENWNNPDAPLYATETLGWGGRLSGPNDGARNDISVDGTLMKNFPDSSCMSCHSTAQWNVQAHKMDRFLLPSFATAQPPGFKLCGPTQAICSPEPGSADWMFWFQDRPGTQPMDADSIATDYDEVFSFKSLALWWKATGGANEASPLLFVQVPGRGSTFNLYNGAPLSPRVLNR